jgi:hypothetical protein
MINISETPLMPATIFHARNVKDVKHRRLYLPFGGSGYYPLLDFFTT